METFKQIQESRYFIGNKGTVKTLTKAKKLSQKTKSNGYKEVCLYLDKKPKMFYVHRLVAEYWISSIEKGYEVNHKDGNKSNNDVNNLEIVTPSENRLHSCHVLGNNPPSFKGERHPLTKLTKDDVYRIRHLYDGHWLSVRDIHKEYEDVISLSALRKICYKSTWKHI